MRREGPAETTATDRSRRRRASLRASRAACAAAAGTQAVTANPGGDSTAIAPAFRVVGGVLHAEGVPLPEIAERFGTPCYVYSRAALEGRFRAFECRFVDFDVVVDKMRVGVLADFAGCPIEPGGSQALIIEEEIEAVGKFGRFTRIN